jgi:hypothetical protein
VLVNYYVYREFEVTFSFGLVLEDVFEGGLEGMGEGHDLGGLFELLSLVGSSSDSTISREVAEEMLLCEVIVQRNICKKNTLKQSAYEVPCSRTARSFSLCRGSYRQTLRYQAFMFRFICDLMSQGMVDKSIALLRRCTITSVRRMGLQILCSKALSRTLVTSRIWWGS